MLKYIALLFNTVALLIYQFFFVDGITVTQKVPEITKPDSEFTVELTINKGTTTGFAKLQQDLPEGFTAEKIETNGASFTFTNQSVKFIWMALPSEKEFKISYKVKVAPATSGDRFIAGKFSYVVDNVKQSVEIEPSIITIDDGTKPPPAVAIAPVASEKPTPAAEPAPETEEPAPTMEPTTEVSEVAATSPADENTPSPASETLTTKLTEDSEPAPAVINEPSSITCVRSAPASAGSEFIVEVAVNKGNMSGFAKFLETLPAGFTASSVDAQGASFTFSDQKVKYVWVSMPSQPEFKISYKVTVDPTVSGNQTIDGVFSFIENDETKKFVLPASTINIGAPGTPASAMTSTPVSTTVTETPTETPTETAITTPAPVSMPEVATTPSAKDLSATSIPSPQGNVNYRVQIAALHRAMDANKLATLYNINEKVNIEMAEGFNKYTVGSHTEYKNARDAREDIKNKGVVGPFVTAYNAGKRITVQEALMISNQKWYK